MFFIYFYFLIGLIRNKIYIDNNKVEEKDERCLPQNSKLDQNKTILLHYTRRSIDKSMYKIS